ncbi:MAG: hypothetical protein KDD10_21910 [Phaeodactylibacter sp.]|nr:hypothetical protein [Phaeodactylibacter sp.]MCB9298088.1 hypothetical protein [Lewinellaceae bacterium]
MKRFSLLSLLFFLTFLALPAQQVVFGNLREHVEEIIASMPGSSGNQFTNLGPSQEEGWRALLELIAEESFADAAAAATGLQYPGGLPHRH